MTTIAELSEELLDILLVGEPLEATLMGVPGYDDLLGDVSVAADAAELARLAALVDRLDALEPPSPAEQREVDIVRALAQGQVARLSAGLADLSATDYFGMPIGFLLSFLPQVVLADPAAAASYLNRLRAVPAYLAAVGGRLEAATAAGRTAVAHLAQRNIDQVDRYLAHPDRDPLLAPQAPAGWDGAADFDAQRLRLLDEVVRPAMTAYRDLVAVVVLPAARPPEQPGLLWLPDGPASYDALLRYHTSTDRTAQEIHQLGLTAIAGLALEYAEVGGRVFGVREPAEVFRLLREDRGLRYESAEQILSMAQAAVGRAEEAAPLWFGTVPSQRCIVSAVPEDQAAGSPTAYYMPPALDGSRPGTYFANTSDPQSRNRFECESVAYHEAVPGHHFQLSLVQELGLSRLRQLTVVTANAEGWGLYAERLAEEMGLYSDDVARLGMLSADSMRAARLVVDTGLHALGWSRQQAVAFCQDNTPMALADIEVEIDRYISDPGQATAYMVGRLEIQRVRAWAQEQLGDRFDIRGFHDAVLSAGSVPLGLLQDLVGDWVAGQLS